MWCSHIIVFIAGATKIGFISSAYCYYPSKQGLSFMSQHLQMRVTKLSHIPAVILASVLALSGAMSRASAHFRS